MRPVRIPVACCETETLWVQALLVVFGRGCAILGGLEIAEHTVSKRLNDPWLPKAQTAAHRVLERAYCQESPRQTKPKKGPKRKVHESRPSLWILVFSLGNKHDSHWTFVPECPCEKFMNWPFFAWFAPGHSWYWSGLKGSNGLKQSPALHVLLFHCFSCKKLLKTAGNCCRRHVPSSPYLRCEIANYNR